MWLFSHNWSGYKDIYLNFFEIFIKIFVSFHLEVKASATSMEFKKLMSFLKVWNFIVRHQCSILIVGLEVGFQRLRTKIFSLNYYKRCIGIIKLMKVLWVIEDLIPHKSIIPGEAISPFISIIFFEYWKVYEQIIHLHLSGTSFSSSCVKLLKNLSPSLVMELKLFYFYP